MFRNFYAPGTPMAINDFLSQARREGVLVPYIRKDRYSSVGNTRKIDIIQNRWAAARTMDYGGGVERW